MTANLFDYFENGAESDARWAMRAPRRPQERFDVKLVPRLPGWREDPASLAELERIAAEPWTSAVVHDDDGVRLRLDDTWLETVGAMLEAGGSAETTLADLARGERYSVQFWDANATKALHIGHLRNLAIGNALAGALAQAGGQVERRSLISDAGRAMGEAMAGVMASGRHARSWPDGDEKSDHFVGECYAEYVAAAGPLAGADAEPEDSLTRELSLRGDAADALLRRVMSGDREALALWYKTRAWVIAGQRRTLARLGVAFDRVFFESDFFADTAELRDTGLRDGRLQRRADGAVIYATGLEDFEELPLVRSDGVPTQHMRSLAYWLAAPELQGTTSMQVCGTEWVSHVTCRRKLMDELMPRGNGNGSPGAHAQIHPTHDIFNGMVARQKRALASSEGALLIDEFLDWLDARIDASPQLHAVRRRHPAPERIAAQVALGYFLSYPVAPPIDFDPEKLLEDDESLGWDMARARARHSPAAANGGRPAEDPDYRFAVVQSELYRRYLRLAVQRFDVGPLALYLKHLARWYEERERSEPVERVVQTLLDRSARGLGLEGA
jgi:arginyl-tRNA synthetase